MERSVTSLAERDGPSLTLTLKSLPCVSLEMCQMSHFTTRQDARMLLVKGLKQTHSKAHAHKNTDVQSEREDAPQPIGSSLNLNRGEGVLPLDLTALQ